MRISVNLEIQHFVVCFALFCAFRDCFTVLRRRQNERNPVCVFDAGS